MLGLSDNAEVVVAERVEEVVLQKKRQA